MLNRLSTFLQISSLEETNSITFIKDCDAVCMGRNFFSEPFIVIEFDFYFFCCKYTFFGLKGYINFFLISSNFSLLRLSIDNDLLLFIK